MLISDIIPYERNARDNSKSVPAIAESIDKFGFRGQIKLRSHDDPTIVAGHHRVAACKLLGWTEIPEENICYCDDLTDDEVKALRLADNRTGEGGKWNRSLVREEVRAIAKAGIDMSKYNFDFKSRVKPYGAEIMRNNNGWNLHLCSRDDCEGKWEFPPLKPVDVKPTDLIGFNYAKSAKEFHTGIHFCIDDYQFERVWNKPEAYLELLRKFECVICPDFSIYIDMPLPMKLWNLYKSRALGYWWQQQGLTVVPNVTFSDESSLEYCYEGLPHGGTIFLSTVGIEKDEEAAKLGEIAINRALEELKPTRVLLLGNAPGVDFGSIEVVKYKGAGFRRG